MRWSGTLEFLVVFRTRDETEQQPARALGSPPPAAALLLLPRRTGAVPSERHRLEIHCRSAPSEV